MKKLLDYVWYTYMIQELCCEFLDKMVKNI